MILARTLNIVDAFARANLMDALAGAGAPCGITGCTANGSTIVVTFDAERTSPELIDALIEIDSTLIPARAARLEDIGAALPILARGLAEPALDVTRVIETYLS